MELWFMLLVSISVSLLVKATVNLLSPPKSRHKLPPGPPTFPIIGNLLWLRKSFADIESILRTLHSKLGPIVTLHIGPRPSIFIFDRSLTHQALIQNGAVFSDRPPPPPTSRIMGANQHNISSSSYGPTWRALRRNLTAEILHPSRSNNYAHARKWVLDILVNNFKSKPDPVLVIDEFQYAMFCLLVLMCFGDKLEEKQIKQIEEMQQKFLMTARRFRVLNFFPRFTKIVMYKRWQEFYELMAERERVLLPLIKSRQKLKTEAQIHNNVCYVDTLLDLQLPGENNNRKQLKEDEIIALCSEFLNAGTDTTSTALQWIMANLVRNPEIQNKLFLEIKGVVRSTEVTEQDLQNLPFLKAIVLEGLRRHPPAHFVLAHAAKEDFVLNGQLLPKNANINFMVADMGWDPKVWEDPMEFKPERFVNNEFDITGSREIKMMPFGVGRRICPGLSLALLHLEYFVANLVLNFKWDGVDGDEISLEEKLAFTMVMKYPLKALLSPRVLELE